jgi:hypothetical protein
MPYPSNNITSAAAMAANAGVAALKYDANDSTN